ncbi:hypothetical protein SMSP2_00868 [Limihaloglobus sulfuriphilus]|uniref:Uncharacterized protein n=1 Tax=Limihaloglobus sulfuriphilus TaxID=1851148 RepID=A0A1Q2MCT4_9BACT|nr:AGE family epimerase/isomerase [Limihaloglobus sulfuriphilus]AQQ70516.1 hypothetical protein SMSP2_00868 [Limihaloglobus sulfuriphilus]
MEHNFNKTELPSNPSPPDLAAVRDDYKIIISRALEAVLDRYEDNDNYPWVDTKLDILTGRDFPDDDIIRGKHTVYGWIQGRALESIAEHAKWLKNNTISCRPLIERCTKVVKKLSDRLIRTRKLNGGHCYFFMDEAGKACSFDKDKRVYVNLTPDSPYNYSDIFCSKGLYAAACYLNDQSAQMQAKNYCIEVIDALLSGCFRSDQHRFEGDLCLPVNDNDKISHGPVSIAIGIANVLFEDNKDIDTARIAVSLIEHTLSNYVNLGQWNYLQEYDFVEFIDADYQPFNNCGSIFSDPGHALEFAGLSLKFTEMARKVESVNKSFYKRLNYYREIMPEILFRNFENGFNPEAEGICKLWDLTNSRPANPDMPWWSLPETMRTAIYSVLTSSKDNFQNQALEIYSLCHNAFINHYLKPELNFFCLQTRGTDKKPKEVIPATPDADPCYHTGLCILDCIRCVDKLAGQRQLASSACE